MEYLIIAILIFGVGTFMIGFGYGRWGLEPVIDDLEAQVETLLHH